MFTTTVLNLPAQCRQADDTRRCVLCFVVATLYAVLILCSRAGAGEPAADILELAEKRKRLEADWARSETRQRELRASGNYADLEKLYSEIIEKYPEFSIGYLNRGHLREYRSRPLEARADFVAALGRGDLDEAAASDLRNRITAINRTAGEKELWDRINRARTEYPALNDWEGLVRFYDGILIERPGFAQGHFLRGNALRRLGRLDEAKADLQEALRLGLPRDVENDARTAIQGIDRRR